jgi:hypothetical protein
MSKIRHIPQTGEKAFITLGRRWVRAAGTWCGAALLAASLLAPTGRLAAADGPAGREGLVLEYLFKDKAADTSGRNHHGQVHGTVGFATGEVGPCAEFDGRGSFIDSGTPLADIGPEFTIECQVKPAATQVENANLFGNHVTGGLGMVMQQDGANANRFAFAYGIGAGGWLTTKPINLTPERWQHLAVVKSRDEVRLYLNGILLETLRTTLESREQPTTFVADKDGVTVNAPKVERPVTPSPLGFRVGLGFDQDSRTFTGSIADFRIWNKALPQPGADSTPVRKFEALVNNTSLSLRAATPSRVFTHDNPPAIEVGFGGGLAGVSEGQIKASFTCVDLSGKSHPVAPVDLNAANGFKAVIRPALPPGYYNLTCSAVASGPLGTKELQPGKLSFSVLPDPARTAVKRGQPKSVNLGSLPTITQSLDGPDWKIATDPKNAGREGKWFEGPRPEAKPTKVPWVIQDIFPDYHGVVWYWHDFKAPANPHAGGRFILRFLAVDYYAEVWLNGVSIGKHEGSEDPFEFDVTGVLKPGTTNRLAVRVLNPTMEPIEGMPLLATTRSQKMIPFTPGTIYNVGGIWDSVELLATPAVRMENLFVRPDWKTGRILIESNVRNAGSKPAKATVRFTVSAANSGQTLDGAFAEQEIPPGDSVVRGELFVPDWKLWTLENPFLYRVSAQVAAAGSSSFDEQTTRAGFRDFRYENNAFRLNGKRIYLQGSLLLPTYPIGYSVMPREDFLRRDMTSLKLMGLNSVRGLWGGLRARDIDLFDELGILLLQEHNGSIQIQDSPQLEERFLHSMTAMIRRDRNHPSVIGWCLLNEMWAGKQFDCAVNSLPLIKHLDDSRFVFLNSGGFDMKFNQGSVSNPGSMEWQCLMGSEQPDGPVLTFGGEYGLMLDNRAPVKAFIHPYQAVPHTITEITRMRTLGKLAPPERKIVIDEIGTGCAANLPRFMRYFEQWGAEHAADAKYYRDKLGLFMTDWKNWKLDRIWTRPEDYFTDSERNMVKLRWETGNALRANPHLAGYYFCVVPESGPDGTGLLNNFREFKPGVFDLQADITHPVRWSLFAEPVNIYNGGKLKLEAVLSDLDALRPGKYPVRIEVVAPDGRRVFEEKISLDVPDPAVAGEQPLVRPVFSREVPVDGPAGAYKFLVYFENGAAATGGEITFNVFDPADMPAVDGEVVLWGKDEGLAKWLADHGIRTRPFAPGQSAKRELILVGTGGGDVAAFRELAARMAQGSTVVFLSPSVFARDGNPLGWLPLAQKGTWTDTDFYGGYFRGDTVCAKHPLFEGLPAGGVMDYTFYRNIITQGGWGISGAQAPDDLMVAGIRAQFAYKSTLQTVGYNFGAGRFIFNTLRIRDMLGVDPVAERLLRNLLNHAGRGLDQPPAELPADFQQQLKAIGYE